MSNSGEMVASKQGDWELGEVVQTVLVVEQKDGASIPGAHLL